MKRIVTVLLTLILIFSTTVVFGATDNVYENVYVIYVTLVHYYDVTYTKPIKVQTLEVGREYGTTVEYYY